jgi:hypothetical protein
MALSRKTQILEDIPSRVGITLVNLMQLNRLRCDEHVTWEFNFEFTT